MTERPSTNPAVQTNARRRALSAAKLVLAVALLVWLARSGRLDVRAFARLDGRALGWIALAALLQVALIVTMAARWKMWLQVFPSGDGSQPKLSWHETLIVTARGTCVGAWTPAGLGLDGIRAAHALRRFRDTASHDTTSNDDAPENAGQAGGIGGLKSLLCGEESVGQVARAVALASLLDRVVALAVLAAMCAPFLASCLGLPLGAVAALGALILALVLALARARITTSGRFSRWKEAAKATAWTALTHSANILAMGAIFQALAPGLGAVGALRLTFEVGPIIILSSALPLTPLGLGVADATGEALLARHGLDCGGEAVMLARALWLGVCLLSGAAFWINEGAAEEAS